MRRSCLSVIAWTRRGAGPRPALTRRRQDAVYQHRDTNQNNQQQQVELHESAEPMFVLTLAIFDIGLRVVLHDLQIESIREEALWSHPQERLRCRTCDLTLTVILTRIVGLRDLVFHRMVSTYSRSRARRTRPEGQIEYSPNSNGRSREFGLAACGELAGVVAETLMCRRSVHARYIGDP